MFTKVCSALAVLVASTLGVAGTAHAQSYKLNQALPEDRDTILQEITIAADRVTATILLRNTSKETIEACAHASARPESFSIKDLDTGKVVKQLGSTGLKACDQGMDTIKPGARKTLKIEFPGLPATARRLQLGENNCQPKPDDDMDYWCFAEVVLTNKK
ncbi:hypothetical protein LJR118_001322 [Acidovorax sp. LjRoot118]|uniref:hypothetical protein n=1 Tax=unclassified Acidovorax TaxID=2684926 RepID=UPI003ECE3712